MKIYKLTKKHRENIGKALELQHQLGLRKEAYKNISKAKIGHSVTKKTRRKISSKNKGKHYSPTTEFKKGDIPWNKGISKYSSITEKELKKMLYLGLSHKEIALKLKYPPSIVSKIRKNLNIDPPEYWIKYKLPARLFKKEEILLISTVLGDGYMRKGKCKHASLTISQKDKYYCNFKYNLMKRWYLSKIKKLKIGNYRSTTISHPVFDYYFDKFYPNGKKIVPKRLLKKINKFGFFIWFQDDGAFCRHIYVKKNGDKSLNISSQLRTDCFSKKENIVLSKFIKRKFDIESSVAFEKRFKNYYLVFDKYNSIKIDRLLSELNDEFPNVKRIINKRMKSQNINLTNLAKNINRN